VSENEIFKEYIQTHVQKAIMEMQISVPGFADQGMNLVILNSDRIQEQSAEWAALRDNYALWKLPQTSALYDQLIYPLIFWNHEGGLSMTKGERLQGAITRICKVFLCLMLQPSGHLFTRSKRCRNNFFAR
jgi:hypothetical protein